MKVKILEFSKKYQIILLTILVAIIGAIAFICIYGIKVLNTGNVLWLENAGDLTQHYTGWTFFRNADWNMKIGTFNSLSYPNYASIIFTDSIPLFAIFFKAISIILPETFQYMGIFGIMCYILQGIFAFTLLRKFIDNKFSAIIGTIFFILSPYMLNRMFGHTALSANFLILAALCLWAYREKYKEKNIKKLVLWTFLLVISSAIHLYYVPMIVIIMLCTFIIEFIENKKTWKWSIITFLVSCILTLLLLYALGGFTNDTIYEIEKNDIRDYNANLNTFINPHTYSLFLKPIEFATVGEGEGFGYLGLGILVLCIISIVLLIRKYNIKQAIKNPNVIFIILCMLFGMLLAIGGSIKLGNQVLFEIRYPEFIEKILLVFRSTGRFIWIPCYLIFLASIYLLNKNINKKIASIIITICMIIQILDLSPYLKNKFTYEERPYTYDKEMWNEELKECNHIAYLPVSELLKEDYFRLTHIARENNCTINNFYFARKVENIEQTSKKYLEGLEQGKIDRDFAYIMSKTYEEQIKRYNVNYKIIDNYIVITPK